MLVTTLFSPKLIELLKPADFVGLKPNGVWNIFIIPWVETHGYAVETHGYAVKTHGYLAEYTARKACLKN